MDPDRVWSALLMHGGHSVRATHKAVAGALLVLLMPVLPSHAQSGRSDPNGDAGPAHVISVNPFLPLWGYFQGEYEQRVKPNMAVALSGSYTRFDDYYTNLDFKLRLYPQERGLHGVGLAGGLGYGAIQRTGEICDDFGVNCHRDKSKEAAPTFSVEGHYQWLLGSTRATAVSVGFGVKRYFISEERSRDINRVLPTGRLTIGYAF